jgi:transketolase
MGLEDIALFGALPDTVILQPCDAISTAKLIPQMVAQKSFVYMRTLRPKTPLLYKNDDSFEIGGSKVLRQSGNDQLTVAATGITVFEALKAADQLQKEGISIRVVDCYSIQPVDAVTLKKCLNETEQKILITVEDHFKHGGFGDFAASAVSNIQGQVIKMAVWTISESGTKNELLNDAGIDAANIITKVKSVLKKQAVA